jgi:PhzF family phenazine biosynthesis protein
MTRLPFFQIDAFAERAFTGNPAAVIPLQTWLPDDVMQAIAIENNLAETAFIVREPSGWRIRWFTTLAEIDLCGHATMASAWVVFHELEPDLQKIEFQSRSGALTVDREGDDLVLDFPSRPGRPAPELIEPLERALGVRPRDVMLARDVLAILKDETTVRSVQPDFEALKALPGLGVLVSAPGLTHDCVSRCFFPGDAMQEDPVTGSAHCTVIPYWAKRLQKTRLRAIQASARSGELRCELVGDRVRMGGRAIKVIEGFMTF